MVSQRRRRKRRKRTSPAAVFVLFLLAAGVLYIAYIAIIRPENLLGSDETAPAIALAGEPDEPGSNNSDSFESDNVNVNETDLPALTLEDNEQLGQVAYSQRGTGDSTDMNPFKAYSFYIPENQLEYEVYQDENPSLSAEDVVWMVNAGLYRSFYSNPELITESNPLLVNPYHQLPENFVPASLIPIDDSGRQATPETVSAFNNMRKGAVADGFDIAVTSAYRTMDYQRGLYERAGGDGEVARPMFSEHHTGRAIDLWGPDGLLDEAGETETGRWVAAHAHEYGFIVRYTAENRHITGYIPEPWHITYVGMDIAREMRSGRYGSLEEYAAKNPDARL